MNRVVVGVDVGGTKTRMRLLDLAAGEVVADRTVPSTGWQTRSMPAAATWLAERVAALPRPGDEVVRVVAGAHGCETPEQCHRLGRELETSLGLPASVVNDAQLLVPAAGLSAGIGLVVGTGSIAVGRHRETGAHLSAGGWGWVLGDEGSGSALVRDAARAVLARADDGAPLEALGRALLRSYGVSGLPELAAAMSWDGGVETWAEHAPAVFAAAAEGSEPAAEVIRRGGAALADLVARLARRGAETDAVVAAGGVIAGQPSLFTAFEEELASLLPGVTATLLREPPVAGAVELARRLAA
ncbi:N-acetylglucosamine kinase [Nonomuraea aridisoli]|uniref:ATPase n=1 Tax=Nonomuraea aridisoli TaxID=2070368 RepID=A0A2W2E984_9ACTN|nr:BadF/BadG/BcrA/BcrD ATPase family protein [Nonomuraea aridisoli]PZG18961.1 ATPase [Nonomuraea aridisoli]